MLPEDEFLLGGFADGPDGSVTGPDAERTHPRASTAFTVFSNEEAVRAPGWAPPTTAVRSCSNWDMKVAGVNGVQEAVVVEEIKTGGSYSSFPAVALGGKGFAPTQANIALGR